MKKRFGKKGGGTSMGGGRSPRITDPGPGLGADGYDQANSLLPPENEINAMFLQVMEGHG